MSTKEILARHSKELRKSDTLGEMFFYILATPFILLIEVPLSKTPLKDKASKIALFLAAITIIAGLPGSAWLGLSHYYYKVEVRQNQYENINRLLIDHGGDTEFKNQVQSKVNEFMLDGIITIHEYYQIMDLKEDYQFNKLKKGLIAPIDVKGNCRDEQ